MYQVLKWLNTLNLQYPYSNPRCDLSSGELVAEIVSKHRDLLNPEQLRDASNIKQRRTNWEFVTRQIVKADMELPSDWASLVDQVISETSAIAGERILEFLFVGFTNQRLIEPKFKQDEQQAPAQPETARSKTQKPLPEKPSSHQLRVEEMDDNIRYRESFGKLRISVQQICKDAYEATFNQIGNMNMFEIFEALKKVDAELDDCDEDLKNTSATHNYPVSIKQIFEFAQSAVGLANIFSDSTDEEICRICFHERFLAMLGDNLEEIIATCCVNLEREVTEMLRLLNIYYYSENDIIFLQNKNLTNAFVVELLEALQAENRRDSHYLEILIHQVILMLPEEYTFATNEFLRSDILLSRIMNSHLAKDDFYGTNFYFMENRLPASPLNQGIEYEFRRGRVIHQTTFVCSILSKFLIFFPKVVAKMINSYIFEQMSISNYHLENPASKEYLSTLRNSAEDEFVIVITEEEEQLEEISNLELLLMDMLIDQFAHTYQYCKPSQLNLVDITEFFAFYALQIDILKFDNTQNNLFLFSYVTKRKSLVVLYLDILTQLIRLLFYNIQIVQETGDVDLIYNYIQSFSQKQNSEMSLIFKCVQIVQRYIMGMSDKYLKMAPGKVPKLNFYDKLQSVVENFICSESDQNIHGILYSTSSICESLYDIIERFVDLALFLYSDRFEDTEIMKFLIEPPALEAGQIDEQFLNLHFIIEQLSNVCTDLVDMIELILGKLAEVREDKAQNKTYSVIDMELDEEPLHACMAELHKYMKKIF